MSGIGDVVETLPFADRAFTVVTNAKMNKTHQTQRAFGLRHRIKDPNCYCGAIRNP